MANVQAATGLLLIDSYNDFISPGGKVWDRLRSVIESNDCVTHMKQVLDAARGAGVELGYDVTPWYAMPRPTTRTPRCAPPSR